MTEQTLTTKQQHYLELLLLAESEQRSICQVAKDNQLDPSLLYSARTTLRRKGYLAVQSSTVPVTGARDERIELKTQLANGQPVWLSVPPDHLSTVLASLSV
jgi:transposase-like protein